MNRIKGIFSRFSKIFNSIFSTRRGKIISAVVVVIIGIVVWRVSANKTTAPQYETAQVTKGTIISSTSASGQITQGGSLTITTQASGFVKSVFVKNGDKVYAGQTIAQVTLDPSGSQKQSQALASLLGAQNSLASAQANLYNLQNQEFVANQKFINDAVARELATDDPTYIEENASWLAAEAAYKNQENVIKAARASLSSASLSYQQASATITSPSTGTVANLSIAPEMQMASSSSSSSTSSSSTSSNQVATIVLSGKPQALVNLSEIDVTKVKTGQKVTLTIDSFPDQTFTGEVINVDTNGVVSSGVTNYPTTILFDEASDTIFNNMSVTANIITSVKNDVLMVPSTAIQTVGGQTEVRVLENGQVTSVVVETGVTSDTDTEIVSGLSEGQTVITGTTTSTQSSSTSTSPFSRSIRVGGGGGGSFVGR